MFHFIKHKERETIKRLENIQTPSLAYKISYKHLTSNIAENWDSI